jgi:hypothetical protein
MAGQRLHRAAEPGGGLTHCAQPIGRRHARRD